MTKCKHHCNHIKHNSDADVDDLHLHPQVLEI